MTHLLLLNIGLPDEKLIRETLCKEPCHIDAVQFNEINTLDFTQEYHLIIVEMDFGQADRLQTLHALRSRFRHCFIVFLFHSSNSALIKQSYLLGDGSIVFPVESEKLLRIIHWYLASGQTRHMESLRAHQPSMRSMRVFLSEYRWLIIALIVLSLAIGALIGFFGADKPDRRSETGRIPAFQLTGGFHDLRN